MAPIRNVYKLVKSFKTEVHTMWFLCAPMYLSRKGGTSCAKYGDIYEFK